MFLSLGRLTKGFGVVEVSKEVVEVGVEAEAEVVGGGGEEDDSQDDPSPTHPHHHLGHFAHFQSGSVEEGYEGHPISQTNPNNHIFLNFLNHNFVSNFLYGFFRWRLTTP